MAAIKCCFKGYITYPSRVVKDKSLTFEMYVKVINLNTFYDSRPPLT